MGSRGYFKTRYGSIQFYPSLNDADVLFNIKRGTISKVQTKQLKNYTKHPDLNKEQRNLVKAELKLRENQSRYSKFWQDNNLSKTDREMKDIGLLPKQYRTSNKRGEKISKSKIGRNLPDKQKAMLRDMNRGRGRNYKEYNIEVYTGRLKWAGKTDIRINPKTGTVNIKGMGELKFVVLNVSKNKIKLASPGILSKSTGFVRISHVPNKKTGDYQNKKGTGRWVIKTVFNPDTGKYEKKRIFNKRQRF